MEGKFSGFSEFNESIKSLKHELLAVWLLSWSLTQEVAGSNNIQ